MQGEKPPARQPVVEEQPGQRPPIRAEARNAMPMRAPTHQVRIQPNQPRFGMPFGEPFEPRQGGPYLEERIQPREEPRHGMANARPPPLLGGNFQPQRE